MNSSRLNQTVETVELRGKGYGVQQVVDNEDLCLKDRAKLVEFNDELTRHLVKRLEVYVYGKDHPKRHVIRYPENWLEAVKERFAPVWIRDRWPVRFTEVTASLEETYPDIAPCLPNHHPVMRVAIQKKVDQPIW